MNRSGAIRMSDQLPGGIVVHIVPALVITLHRDSQSRRTPGAAPRLMSTPCTFLACELWVMDGVT